MSEGIVYIDRSDIREGKLDSQVHEAHQAKNDRSLRSTQRQHPRATAP